MNSLYILLVVIPLTYYYSSYFVSTESVTFHACSYNSSHNCTINDVTINPCPEALEDEPCLVYRGTNSGIIFDYTPKFSGNQLKARAYSSTFLIDIPFLGMDTNACSFTKCPAVPNQKAAYNFSLDVKYEYPPGPYSVKWRLWNEDEEECCFLVNIKIV